MKELRLHKRDSAALLRGAFLYFSFVFQIGERKLFPITGIIAWEMSFLIASSIIDLGCNISRAAFYRAEITSQALLHNHF